MINKHVIGFFTVPTIFLIGVLAGSIGTELIYREYLPTKVQNNIYSVAEKKVDNEYQNLTDWGQVAFDNYEDRLEFNYPLNLGIDISKTITRRLATDIGQWNYKLLYLDNPDIETAELTTDLLFIYYLESTETNEGKKLTLKRANLMNKNVDVIDEFVFKDNIPVNVDSEIIGPHYNNLFAYNWFEDDSTLRGRVVKVSDLSYSINSPCKDELSIGINFDLSEDGNHVLFNCEGKVYMSDFLNIFLLDLPGEILDARHVAFQDNNSVRLIDYGQELSPDTYQGYTINFSGEIINKEVVKPLTF